MGRLKKLRIEATKKANEALADRQKREIRAKKEVDYTKTAQNSTKDDVFNIVGIDRAKSTGGVMQMLSESSPIKENEEAQVPKNPYIHWEKEKMDETLKRMNRILNYDVTKTKEENREE